MEADLDLLHDKVHDLARLCRELRADNDQLKTQLAVAEQANGDLACKLDETRARIEGLLARLPEID